MNEQQPKCEERNLIQLWIELHTEDAEYYEANNGKKAKNKARRKERSTDLLC